MGKYGPRPIHEIGKYRRLGRGALLLLVVVGFGLAYESRGGAVEPLSWLLGLGMIAAGAGLGLWKAATIVRRADDIHKPGFAAQLTLALAVLVAAAGLGVLRATVEESDQRFFMLAGAAGCLTYLATMGSVVALRLRAITSGERAWPWPSRLD
jgi:hypothetical protein